MMRASAAGLPSRSPSIAPLQATAISSMAAAASSARPCTLWSARKASAGARKSAENLSPCPCTPLKGAVHAGEPGALNTHPAGSAVHLAWRAVHSAGCARRCRKGPGQARAGCQIRGAASACACGARLHDCSSACALMPLMPKALVPGAAHAWPVSARAGSFQDAAS